MWTPGSWYNSPHLCRETGTEIAIQSSNELEQLRNRLRKMTDAQLMSFGKAARSLCRDPKCPEVFKRQLEESTSISIYASVNGSVLVVFIDTL